MIRCMRKIDVFRIVLKRMERVMKVEAGKRVDV